MSTRRRAASADGAVAAGTGGARMGSLGFRARQGLAVALFEVRRIHRGRHAFLRTGLLGVPLLVAALIALGMVLQSDQPFTDPLTDRGTETTAVSELAQLAWIFRLLALPLVLFLACLDLFANLFRLELTEKTLHHVFLRPVRREVVVVGKYVAGVFVVACAASILWLAACATLLAPHGAGATVATLLSAQGLKHVACYLLVVVLASVAYGGVFLVLGLVNRSPMLAGVGFMAWEWLSRVLPLSFKRMTLVHYLDSLMPLRVPPDSAWAVISEPESPWVAVLVLLGVGAAGVALSALLARRLELASGGD